MSLKQQLALKEPETCLPSTREGKPLDREVSGDSIKDRCEIRTSLPDVNAVTPRYDMKLLGSSAFASKEFTCNYLVKGLLVEGQPAIIGGPKKCLKTGSLIDLAVSLGTGTPFMGHRDFIVPEKVRTCVLSGESGGFTLKETATRICKARSLRLESADVLWGFDLPQLANPDHLDAVEKTIREQGIRVLIIDPAYLCLLAGASGVNPGSVFAMGEILKPIGELGERTGCTIVLVHHTRKKDRRERLTPTDLEDLAMSGFAEWARQWLLLGRRVAFAGDGKHELWMDVGGSAGHSGCFAVSVDEGVANDELSGRYWSVSVELASTVRERSKAARDLQKERELEARLREKREALLAVVRSYEEGETKNQLRKQTKPQPSATDFDELIVQLIEQGDVERCEVKKNRTTHPGFRPVVRSSDNTVSATQ